MNLRLSFSYLTIDGNEYAEWVVVLDEDADDVEHDELDVGLRVLGLLLLDVVYYDFAVLPHLQPLPQQQQTLVRQLEPLLLLRLLLICIIINYIQSIPTLALRVQRQSYPDQHCQNYLLDQGQLVLPLPLSGGGWVGAEAGALGEPVPLAPGNEEAG